MTTNGPTESDHHAHRRRRQRIRERIRFKLPRPGMKAVRRMAVAAAILLAVGGAGTWGVVYLLHPRPAEPVPPPEPRLIGTWVSDADANIAELRKTRAISRQDEEEVRARLFKSRVTYTDEVITIEIGGGTRSEAYQVLRRDADSVAIRYWLDASMKNEEFSIHFLGPDRYRLDAPQFSLTEYFRRAPDKQEPGRP